MADLGVELIMIGLKDSSGREWKAAGQMVNSLVPKDGRPAEGVVRLGDLEAIGPVSITEVKVVR